MSNNDFIEFFDGGKEPALDSLGGKGASLVTMTAAGMPVPPGFVVNTAAFRAFMGTGLEDSIKAQLDGLDPEDIAAVDAASAAIRELITSRPVPADLREVTRAAYDALQARFDSEAPLAVRSSATAEDLPDASFAGQQDTYLWLTGFDSVPAEEQHPG